MIRKEGPPERPDRSLEDATACSVLVAISSARARTGDPPPAADAGLASGLIAELGAQNSELGTRNSATEAEHQPASPELLKEFLLLLGAVLGVRK